MWGGFSFCSGGAPRSTSDRPVSERDGREGRWGVAQGMCVLCVCVCMRMYLYVYVDVCVCTGMLVCVCV